MARSHLSRPSADGDRAADTARGSAPPADAPPLRRPMAAFARALTAELLAALAPPACLACRAGLHRSHERLCAACRRELPWLTGPHCPRCGLPAPCPAPCPAAGAAFSASWAPLAHDGPARALVVALKFRGALPVADLMAAQIVARAPRELLAGAVVPVPADPARRRRRGFDQAERVAAALARRADLPLVPCLRRVGRSTRQLGASREARLARGRIAVAVHGRPPRRAVLVDDVHTTGATLDACARALRAAGSADVVALAYARALP